MTLKERQCLNLIRALTMDGVPPSYDAIAAGLGLKSKSGMKERPILFSAPMVRAILDGRKTQTRRVIKPQPGPGVNAFTPAEVNAAWQEGWIPVKCPYGDSGDRLWVRENFAIVPASAYRMSEGVQQTINPNDRDMAAIYAAGWDRSIPRWKPSIHMPHWASRITLEITDVRVERLNDISEADAIAEGCKGLNCPPDHEGDVSPQEEFRDLWQSINAAKHPWSSNPWVWVIAFKRVEA